MRSGSALGSEGVLLGPSGLRTALRGLSCGYQERSGPDWRDLGASLSALGVVMGALEVLLETSGVLLGATDVVRGCS